MNYKELLEQYEKGKISFKEFADSAKKTPVEKTHSKN